MESINESNEDSTVNKISFNQDYSLISIGTNCGYKIIQMSPLLIHEKNLLGGILHCELSYRSNLLALVGGGKIPKFNPKKVVIYNDLEECVENEFKFSTPVLNVKFKKTYIFIVCEKKIYVFNITTTQNVDAFDTIINKRGIIAINGSEEITIMAFPIELEEDEPNKQKKGYVGVKNYKTKKYFTLLVHEEQVSYMEMDYNGLLLATVNSKGNIIRIHNLLDKTLVFECNRGIGKAIVNYICFDPEYNYIGITSNKGTIHLWKLDDIIEKEINNEGVNYKVKTNKGYKTDTSFAKIKINKPNCIFCFRPGKTLLIISQDEKYYLAKFDQKGGTYNAIEQKNFYSSTGK